MTERTLLLDVHDPHGCSICGELKHMGSECPIDDICDCHIRKDVNDMFNRIRSLLCRTDNCEDSPNCPEGTDGCVVYEICKIIESRERKAVVEYDDKVFSFFVVCDEDELNYRKETLKLRAKALESMVVK